VLVALSQWGNEFLFAENECGVLVDSEQRKPCANWRLSPTMGAN
jgi:hypothetical protein